MFKCKNIIFNNCNNIIYITFTYITKYIYFHVIAIIKNYILTSNVYFKNVKNIFIIFVFFF